MSRRYLETKQEGQEVESALKTKLEEVLDDFLLPQETTAPLDFRGTKCWAEIKGRAPPYRSDDKYADAGWFIGMPKVLACKQISEPVFFFYYFRSDKTLWKIQYQDELFSQFRPFKNRQGQATIAIPKRYWTPLGVI